MDVDVPSFNFRDGTERTERRTRGRKEPARWKAKRERAQRRVGKEGERRDKIEHEQKGEDDRHVCPVAARIRNVDECTCARGSKRVIACFHMVRTASGRGSFLLGDPVWHRKEHGRRDRDGCRCLEWQRQLAEHVEHVEHVDCSQAGNTECARSAASLRVHFCACCRRRTAHRPSATQNDNRLRHRSSAAGAKRSQGRGCGFFVKDGPARTLLLRIPCCLVGRRSTQSDAIRTML